MTLSRASLGTALSVAAAVLVTAQAVSAPPKPRKARDLVPVSADMQPGLALVCQMYPSECRFNADGSVARVVGRRIAPGTDRAVLQLFRTEVGAMREAVWAAPEAADQTSRYWNN
jgi:hypothetical protein